LPRYIPSQPQNAIENVHLCYEFIVVLSFFAYDTCLCSDLLPHCLEILKTAHQLTDKLVSVTLTSAHQLQFPETLTDLVAVARRIGTRVDDVVRALYPPLDPRLLEAR